MTVPHWTGSPVLPVHRDEGAGGVRVPDCVTLCYRWREVGAAIVASRHLTIRLDEDILERLDAESRRAGTSRSQLARDLLDEGLRTQAHPGIVFRSGPAGRRAGLTLGPDVWEVARVFLHVDASGDALLEQTAALTGLAVQQVQVALRYYAEFPQEIDTWISRVDDEATQAEESWLREQALVQR